MNSYNPLKKKDESMDQVTTRPMFGYQCFSINKKFFVGFNSKNSYQVIVRLPKDQQAIAIKSKAIKPFSHGAKTGWIEIDTKIATTTAGVMKWVLKGHEHARTLGS